MYTVAQRTMTGQPPQTAIVTEDLQEILFFPQIERAILDESRFAHRFQRGLIADHKRHVETE